MQKKSGAVMNLLEEKQLEKEENEQILRQKSRERLLEVARKKRKKKRMRKIILTTSLLIAAAATVTLCFVFAETILQDMTDVEVDYSANNTPVNEKAPKEDVPEFVSSGYDHIEYSDASKNSRYDSYKMQNPELSDEEIVWRVNANLDKPMYEFDIPVSGYDDPYIIVNKYYTVPEGYRPPDLEDFGGGQLLREETGNAYVKMREDAQKEGLNIRLVSGYRTVEYQEGLYNRYLGSDTQENVDRYSARPGHSEHHTGMAMDIFGSQDGLRNFENTPEYPWVRDNCHKYGFIIRYLKETESITGYEAEPWHLRYVGVEVATDMKEKNIKSFEEYHAKYIG